jgi:hypothetical protein
MGKEVGKEKKKISKSGRLLIRPKKLRTSSDDGLPRKKRSKGQITVREEFERLRQSEKDIMISDEPKQISTFSEQNSTFTERNNQSLICNTTVANSDSCIANTVVNIEPDTMKLQQKLT